MKSNCHIDLEEVAASFEILSATSYSFDGEVRDLSMMQISAQPSVAQSKIPNDNQSDNSTLLALIVSELYNKLYQRSPKSIPASQGKIEIRDFICALSKANQGIGTWEPGWKIASIEKDGFYTVVKDNLIFWAKPEEVRMSGKKVRPGEECRVKIGKEIRQLIPGFYMAIGNGNALGEGEINSPTTRIYWNLTFEAATQYIKHVTEIMNMEKIPFRTKVLMDPCQYIRADAGVLYINKNDWPKTNHIIAEIHRKIEKYLKPDVPMFTKRLGYGLSLAEDPGNGMSFGESRCKIITRGLWSCFLQGETGVQSRLNAIVSSFREEGLEPESPYLNSGSIDIYEINMNLNK